MKLCIISLSLFIALQVTSGQNDPVQLSDLAFNKTEFEKAKIDNEDASKFFLNYKYDGTINNRDGNVLVSFIVRKDGSIDSIQFLNEPAILYKLMTLDALKQSSGHWNPCKFDNILFDKQYVAGFNFTKLEMFKFKKEKSLRLLRTGQVTRPLRIINEALNINPFDIDLLQWRSEIYRKKNNKYRENIDLLLIEKLKTDLIFNIWF